MNKQERKQIIDQEKLYQDARKVIHGMVVSGDVDDQEMEELTIHIYIKFGRYRSFLPEGLKNLF